jgi:hypothetical protein
MSRRYGVLSFSRQRSQQQQIGKSAMGYSIWKC